MKTQFKTIKDIINEKDNSSCSCPLDLSIIPNYLGINLCSVEGVAWTCNEGKELISITIHFLPSIQ